MRTYDNPLVLSYFYSQIDFGTGTDITRLLPVPILENARKPGGKVLGVEITNITEAFAGATTDASVQVGISGDIDKYFQSRDLDENDDTGEVFYLRNADTAAVDIESGRTDVTVTFVSATGTPTGIADVTLRIAWY